MVGEQNHMSFSFRLHSVELKKWKDAGCYALKAYWSELNTLKLSVRLREQVTASPYKIMSLQTRVSSHSLA